MITDGVVFPSGPRLWLKADVGLYVTPNQWDDQSGLNNNFLSFGGSRNPTTGVGINGHTAVSFLNTNYQCFYSANPFSHIFPPSTENTFSYFAVFQYTGSNPLAAYFNTPIVIGDSLGGTGMYGIYAGTSSSPGPLAIWGYDGIAPGQGIQSLSNTSAAHYVSLIQNGVGTNSLALSVDGVAAGTADGADASSYYSSFSSTYQFVGTSNSAVISPLSAAFPSYWTGYIGEVIIWNRTLTALETAVVNLYLKNKWGF